MNSDSVDKAKLYTDFSELNSLKSQAKDRDPEALQAVAEQFEQLFLNMLMKSMRQANESFGADNPLNSSSVKFYQEMLDSQLTKEMAETKGIGLADAIVKQLSPTYGDPAKRDNNEEASEAEQFLNRAFDISGGIAAPAILGQAQRRASESAEADSVRVTDESVKTATPEPAVTETLPANFASPEEFVQQLLPLAESVASELGVDPRVLLAQAALETGWGKHIIQQSEGSPSYNLFNIKADSRWNGDQAQVNTLEYREGVAQQERASFRVYGSYEESFKDYVQFLNANPRYEDALQKVANPFEYVEALQQAGYATDPEYSNKISRIYSGDILNNSDSASKET